MTERNNAQLLQLGRPVPWLQVPMLDGPADFDFAKLGGRHVLMLFFGSAAEPQAAAALRAIDARRQTMDQDDRIFVGVTVDPSDKASGRIRRTPGTEFLLDHDRRVSRMFGAARQTDEGVHYEQHWLLIDPTLRVIGRWPIEAHQKALAALDAAIASTWHMPAPVLIVPNVLEPDFCRELIALYEADGGSESGFMRQVGGKTVGMYDPRMKRRRDCDIVDETLRNRLRLGITRNLVPMIERAFNYRPSRIERYIVACYDAADGGHFAKHRDNTTSATAHRQFAVTINLNDAFEGGGLSFPEFGPQSYRAPVGGAVVFSCSLLHAAGRVTAGRRYATLPFLYDDKAAAVREENRGTRGADLNRFEDVVAAAVPEVVAG